MKKYLGILIVVAAAFALAQDKAEDVAKKDLPEKGVCVVCNEGEEKVAAGVMYKGKAYYFCSAKEVPDFKKNPEANIPLVIPGPMPDFDFKDEAGKPWNAETMKDKLVVLDYWATWCGPCKEIMPAVHDLREKYAPKGVEVLSVSVDQKRGDLTKFLKEHKFNNPVIHDTKQNFGKWKVKFIPTLFLVKDGQIVGRYAGNELKKLDEDIEKNLS